MFLMMLMLLFFFFLLLVLVVLVVALAAVSCNLFFFFRSYSWFSPLYFVYMLHISPLNIHVTEKKKKDSETTSRLRFCHFLRLCFQKPNHRLVTKSRLLHYRLHHRTVVGKGILQSDQLAQKMVLS